MGQAMGDSDPGHVVRPVPPGRAPVPSKSLAFLGSISNSLVGKSLCWKRYGVLNCAHAMLLATLELV